MNKLEIVRACRRCGKLQKKNEKESNRYWNVYDVNVICECGGNFAYMPKYESDDLQKGVIK